MYWGAIAQLCCRVRQVFVFDEHENSRRAAVDDRHLNISCDEVTRTI